MHTYTFDCPHSDSRSLIWTLLAGTERPIRPSYAACSPESRREPGYQPVTYLIIFLIKKEKLIKPFNERTDFDIKRFMKDLESFARTHPRFRTSATTTTVGFISQETGIDRGTLRYAQVGGIESIKVICRLAGWAGFFLDEYREDLQEG